MTDLQSSDYPLDSAANEPKKKKSWNLNPCKKKIKDEPAALSSSLGHPPSMVDAE